MILGNQPISDAFSSAPPIYATTSGANVKTINLILGRRCGAAMPLIIAQNMTTKFVTSSLLYNICNCLST